MKRRVRGFGTWLAICSVAGCAATAFVAAQAPLRLQRTGRAEATGGGTLHGAFDPTGSRLALSGELGDLVLLDCCGDGRWRPTARCYTTGARPFIHAVHPRLPHVIRLKPRGFGLLDLGRDGQRITVDLPQRGLCAFDRSGRFLAGVQIAKKSCEVRVWRSEIDGRYSEVGRAALPLSGISSFYFVDDGPASMVASDETSHVSIADIEDGTLTVTRHRGPARATLADGEPFALPTPAQTRLRTDPPIAVSPNGHVAWLEGQRLCADGPDGPWITRFSTGSPLHAAIHTAHRAPTVPVQPQSLWWSDVSTRGEAIAFDICGRPAWLCRAGSLPQPIAANLSKTENLSFTADGAFLAIRGARVTTIVDRAGAIVHAVSPDVVLEPGSTGPEFQLLDDRGLAIWNVAADRTTAVEDLEELTDQGALLQAVTTGNTTLVVTSDHVGTDVHRLTSGTVQRASAERRRAREPDGVRTTTFTVDHTSRRVLVVERRRAFFQLGTPAGALTVLDAGGRRELGYIEVEGPLVAAVMSNGGEWVAYSEQTAAGLQLVLATPELEPVRTLPTGAIWLAPASDKLLIGHDGRSLSAWTLPDLAPVPVHAELPRSSFGPSSPLLGPAAVSPDGRTLALACFENVYLYAVPEH